MTDHRINLFLSIVVSIFSCFSWKKMKKEENNIEFEEVQLQAY